MGIKAWITVNGNHIPIMDGESKMAAVGRFIKGKQEQKLDNIDELRKKYKARSNDKYYSEKDRKYFANKAKELAKREVDLANKQITIKGRVPSKDKYERLAESERMFAEIYKQDAKNAGRVSLYNSDIMRKAMLKNSNEAKEKSKYYDYKANQKYKLKEKYKVGDIYTNGDSTFRIVAHPKTGKPMAQYYDKYGVYHQSIIDKDWEKGMAISRTKYKKVKK